MASQVLYTAVFLALGEFSECANKRGRMEGYVVGGEYTTIDKFPHAVYLSINCEGSQWLCGASVVNQRILITAAHCLEPCDKSKNKIKCFAGHEHVQQAVSSRIERFNCHDRYSDDNLSNDLAMAATKKPLPLGDKIKRIVIPIRFPDNVKKAKIAGWGLIHDKEGSKLNTKTLKAVDQVVRDLETCEHFLGELESGTFCAGEVDNLENRPSMGDSGSGLIHESRIEIGIVSYRVEKHPGLMVYTNVTYFYPWIEKTAMDLYCKIHSNESNSTP